MTDKEKAIVMAYTGFCMLSGNKLPIFYEYVESIMGRPVYTHEMAIKAVDDEIKEKAKADFIALCAEQEHCTDAISRQAVLDIVEREQNKGDALFGIEQLPPVQPQPKTGRWINKHKYNATYECDNCGRKNVKSNYCPNCGRKMETEWSEKERTRKN